MDNFELKPPPKKVNTKSLFWNVLTILALLSICCLGFYFVTIYLNPNSPYNPFPPPALPTQFQTSTPTSTIVQLPATWTPTVTAQPSPSRTRAATWTPLPGMITPSITPTPGTPTITLTPMPAAAEITYKASTEKHPESACEWLGVGGRVLDKAGKPLQYQVIQMGGNLGGKEISYLALSGTASAYGPAGFEFVLGNEPVDSTQTLWIQLLDNTAKEQLTEKIYFDTFEDCNKNLILVVFTKTR